MTNLDSRSALKKYDHSDMASVIASFPGQCRKAREIGLASEISASYSKAYKNIICTGMGGSAIGADIARSYTAGEAGVPVFVNRNYALPAFVGKDSLVIASSYSGNTEETISAVEDAIAKGARVIAITSGGRIADIASRASIPVVRVPPGLQPRAALGYSFFTLITVMSKVGLIGDKAKDIEEAVKAMEGLRDSGLAVDVAGRGNIAKDIARRIYSKIPVIYSGAEHIDAVGTRWRGQFAENSKTLASTNVFPELTHNEIVGWEYPEKAVRGLAVIMLRDRGDHARVSKRMDIVRKLVRALDVEVIEVQSHGDGLLARIFSLIYTGDYASLYLALLNKCDPTPVERIAYLKTEMGKK